MPWTAEYIPNPLSAVVRVKFGMLPEPMKSLESFANQATYRDRQFLAQPGRDKAQDNTTDRNSQPKARGCHTTSERATVSHPNHEGDDPPSQSDFNADITQQEERA